MLTNILLWALFGLIAGAVAKFLLPGRDPGGSGLAGWIITILIGIAGSVVGGYLSSHLLGFDVTGFNLQSFAVAIGRVIVLRLPYRLLAGRAPTRCPVAALARTRVTRPPVVAAFARTRVKHAVARHFTRVLANAATSCGALPGCHAYGFAHAR